MSERTVSENNKLWEAAERMAEKVVADQKAASEEEKRKQKKRLVKLILMMVLIMLVIIFASIAWFAQNKAVSANTMAIEANEGDFSITPLGTEAGRYDSMLASAKTLAGTTGAATWTVKSTSPVDDIGNANIAGQAEKDQGIKPGSEGVISFVLSTSNTVNASFDFNLYAYSYDEEADNPTLELLTASSQSQDVQDALGFLNGHILLFKSRTGNAPGQYKYSGLIKNANDLRRVYSDHAAFTGQTTVPIYWVWPETLAQITLDDGNSSLYGKNNICSTNTDKNEILTFLKNNPGCFLKGTVDFSEMSTSELKTEIDENYDRYSVMYNEADQIIGITIQYMLFDMKVTSMSS